MKFPLSRFVGGRDALSKRLGVEVEVLLERCEFDPLEDSIVVSGSLIEGFGNRGSDIDLFIVGRRSTQNKGKIIILPNSNRQVDVVPVSIIDIEQLIDRISGVQEVPADWVSYDCADFGDVDLYHRLLIGVRITDPVSEYWNDFEFSRVRLGREIAYQNIVAARARWADAIGALQDEQFAQAWYFGGIVIEHAADAYCALLGETNPSPKWRWARVERLRATGRDPLGMSSTMMSTLSLGRCEFSERARLVLAISGEWLAQVQSLLLSGEVLSLEPLSNPCERYEPTRNGVYVIGSAGSAERAKVVGRSKFQMDQAHL